MATVVSELLASPDVLAQYGGGTAAERERVAGFDREVDAQDYLAARVLTRQCVRELAGADEAIAQRCEDCGEVTHGRPFVIDRPDIFISWSHASGHVIATASYDPVGIDLELLPADGLIDLRRFVTPTELAAINRSSQPGLESLKLWVAKEALFKAGAIGLDDFATTEVEAVPDFTVSWLIDAVAVVGLAEAATAPESP